MNKVIIFVIVLYSAVCSMEGPDFMFIGRNYIADPHAFNICSSSPEDSGFRVSLDNASLYSINSLDWLYAGAGYSYRHWTFCGSFKSYGINNLYESTAYSIIIHRRLIPCLSLGAGVEHRQKTYGDNLYNHRSTSLSIDLGLKFSQVYFDAIISNLAIADHDKLIDGDPESILSGNWLANDALTIYTAYYRDNRGHDRLMVGQDLSLHESLIINAGFLSSPEVYFFGVEIIYKRFKFSYNFYDISGLPDCSKVALSFR
jgi:hypothetical protein